MPEGRKDQALVTDRFVRADWTDLRDFPYQPSLAVLRPELLPDRARLPPHVRDQKDGARCTGHALANLIDLQRRHAHPDPQALPPDDVVSADMLYRMGAYHDDLPVMAQDVRTDAARLAARLATRPEGLQSLRSVLKGFFHHGVCLDLPPGVPVADPAGRWESDGFRAAPRDPPQVFPEVAQAKAARAIGLGAFYRLRPVLNDYHAALNDTGGILVSAQTHPGWTEPFRGKDVIGDLKLAEVSGSHAVVIVGYTREGFLVLNSWGPGWGGGTRWPPGVALWRYGDWAATVMDGWVLRLGVPAPDAFDLSAGEQGWMRTMGLIRSAAPRSGQLIGHYLHLDDGFHVEHGSFPCNAQTWDTTHRHLRATLPGGRAAKHRGLLLWLPGSVEGLEDAARAAIARNARARGIKLYPYSFFWCHLFADKSIEVLTSVFASCQARVGSQGPELDALIERDLRGIGRAIWRDIELSAQRAVRGPNELPEEHEGPARGGPKGFLLEPFRDMLRLAAETGCELHLVTEGAGVLVLHELLRALGPDGADDLERITTLSLVHPAIDMVRASRHVIPLVRRLNAGDRAGRVRRPRACIYRASAALEARISFDSYGGSLLGLVARSFEDRHPGTGGPLRDANGLPRPPTHPDHPPRMFLGMADAFPDPQDRDGLPVWTLKAVADARHATGKVPHHILRDDPQIPDRIFSTIAARRARS